MGGAYIGFEECGIKSAKEVYFLICLLSYPYMRGFTTITDCIFQFYGKVIPLISGGEFLVEREEFHVKQYDFIICNILFHDVLDRRHDHT